MTKDHFYGYVEIHDYSDCCCGSCTGSECLLTPEESIAIQNAIGGDIMMQLDDVVDVTETDYDRFQIATHRCFYAVTCQLGRNCFQFIIGLYYNYDKRFIFLFFNIISC